MNKTSGIIRQVLVLTAMLVGCIAVPSYGLATNVLFTVDVCWTCGSDFKGGWNGKEYGVPLIVEILERHGIKGVFFVSPYCPPGLENDMISHLRFLTARGHDLQLHTHPDVFDVNRPLLTMYDKEEKRKIIAAGVRNIILAGAPPPIAHRAGAYALDDEVMGLPAEFGIHIDSSVFPGSPNCKVALPRSAANRFTKIGGVYELPITLIELLPFIGYAGTTQLSLDRTVWLQQRAALEKLADQNVPVATIFLHFSSLYKHRPAQRAYEPHIVTGPDLDNIEALGNMAKLVSTDARFKPVTVRELWAIHEADPKALEGPAVIPYVGIWPTYVACVQQFFGHSTAKKLVALAPIVLVLGAAGVIWLTLRARRRRERVEDHPVRQ
ncbi:MAG: hypothetical protein V2B18_23505 [Pseudomonadota bacterium]